MPAVTHILATLQLLLIVVAAHVLSTYDKHCLEAVIYCVCWGLLTLLAARLMACLFGITWSACQRPIIRL